MIDRFRVLTFDVVGTLIDFEQGILDCLHTHVDTDDLGISDQALLEAFARAEDHQQRTAPHLPFSEMLAPIQRQMSGELGLPVTDDGALRASIPEWPAFPDSVAALRRLGARHRLVALTNAGRWATEQMATTLGEPFDDVVTVEDVGVNKPDPQVFAFCRGRQSVHGYELDDYLHVAQSQYHDIAAAERLGFATCWVERRAGQDSTGATPARATVTVPDLHVATLAELADALDSS